MPDPFDIVKTLETEGTTFFLKEGLKSLISYIKIHKGANNNLVQNKIEDQITPHFAYMLTWAKQLEFIGIGGQLFKTELSIPLKYSRSNRFGIKEAFEEKDYNIDELLNLQEHVFIEGEPGAGKTTTLKKLLNDYFFDGNVKACPFSLPLVVRFRELTGEKNLYVVIAKLLGVVIESKFEKKSHTEKVYKNTKTLITPADIKLLTEEELDNVRIDEVTNKIYLINEQTTYKEVIKEVEVFYVNSTPIEDFIINLLNSRNILLLFDGLDELDIEITDEIQKHVAELALKLVHSKMIITSRFGFGNYAFENFSFFYIKDLDDAQINTIAEQMLNEDGESFLTLLKGKSYFELVNRALFLSLLIFIYKKNKNKKSILPLPESSVEVYNEVLDLFIISWDEDRHIPRSSKYGLAFDKNKKKKFLSHLSYYLTYKLRKKEFSVTDLEHVYYKIHHKFDLPRNEAKSVAKEISQHTGLIIPTGHSNFEFSHLVIQEYLCAKYISTMPTEIDSIKDYVNLYPAPLAMVIAISDTSVDWLYYLFNSISSIEADEGRRTSIYIEIMRRLIREAPYLENSPKLSLAIAKVFEVADCSNAALRDIMDKALTSFPNITASFEQILPYYSKPTHTFFKRRFNFIRNITEKNELEVPIPGFVSIIDTDNYKKIIYQAYDK